MDKPKLKYAVVTGKNPQSGETQITPRIVDRVTYYINSVIEYALNAAYLRGQLDDMTGIVRGFFRACKELVNSGFAVNLADWIRIHPELTGLLGEDRQLSSELNGIKVRISPLSEMKKLTIDDFTWTSTEDTGKKVAITNVFAPNGDDLVIVKGKDIIFAGKNMVFVASYGDKMTVNYDGLATPIQISPKECSYSQQRYEWPAALSELETGTVVKFTLTSRAGVEGAPDQVTSIVAVYHAA